MTQAEQELNELRDRLAQPPMSPTLAEMNKLAFDIAVLRDEEKKAADAKKLVTEALETKENRVIELLLESGSNSYRSPAGLLSLSFRTSAKLPVGPEKTKFYEHLKAIGRFDDMVSVSSPTYTAFVKEQYDLAKEEGKDEPCIPGVSEVKVSPRLSFTRTR